MSCLPLINEGFSSESEFKVGAFLSSSVLCYFKKFFGEAKDSSKNFFGIENYFFGRLRKFLKGPPVYLLQF